jgi:deazaflavin-dependent oxidoreductase (nitroreductase family)
VSTSHLSPAPARRVAELYDAALREAPKHTRLLRSARDGRRLSAMMLPVYAIATPPGHGLLATVGRRSGKRRRKCIRAIRRGDTAYALMLRLPTAAIKDPSYVTAWVLNIRANPEVRLKLGRRTYDAIAREIADPGELQTAREALCETVHLVDYGECDLHLRGLPRRDKIRDLHRYWFDTGVPIAVDLVTTKR